MLKLVRLGSHKKAEPDKDVIVLQAGRVYTVGRKGADICFENDTSVSRSHAQIQIEHPTANLGTPSIKPSLSLTDLGSKFGSFINDGIENKIKASVQESHIIAPGGRIRIGVQWNEFRFEYTPLVITTSQVKDLTCLKKTIRMLGGHIVPEWEEGIDYLVMEEIKLTIKVVGALIFGKYIVTPSYFDDYLKAAVEGQNLPNPGDYFPPLQEKSLLGTADLFKPSSRRDMLFREKYFIFPDEKLLKNYSSIIKRGGGKSSLLVAGLSEQIVERHSSVIIGDMALAHLQATVHGSAKLLLEAYLQKGKRIVPEKEIGLAVVHIDTSVFTNPDAKNAVRTSQQVLSSQLNSDETQRSIIPNTQEASASGNAFNTMTPSGKTEYSVPILKPKRERLDNSVEEAGASKRRCKEESFDVNSEAVKCTQNSNTTAKSKEKKLASLFFDSSDDEPEPSTASTQVVPATIPTQAERAAASSSFSTSMGARYVDTTRAPIPDDSDDFEIPPTPASETIMKTSSQQIRLPSASSKIPLQDIVAPENTIPHGASERLTRSKRRNIDEVEESHIERDTTINDAVYSNGVSNVNKRRKVLEDNKVPASTELAQTVTPVIVQSNGHDADAKDGGQNQKDGYDKVRPLEYSFASLILTESSNQRNRKFTLQDKPIDDQSEGVNFKRFRKVLPTFATAPVVYTFIPQLTCGSNVIESGAFQQDRHFEPTNRQDGENRGNARTGRQRRRGAVPTMEIRNEPAIQDDFSFE